jgi:ABC-type uncharacterized transport system substrate-binding protein
MDRRRFLLTSFAGAITAPLGAGAQQAGKMYRVGILSVAGGALVQSSPLPAFFQRLRDLGWVEGQNIAFERRVAFDPQQDLKVFAAELIRAQVDVILAAGGPATLNAARSMTKSIPIIMVASSRDPIADGLVRSYARPGGNITGIVTAPPGFTGKQLELLLNAVGGGNSRLGVLWDTTTGPARVDEQTAETIRALGIDFRHFDVHTPADLDAAIAAAANERVGGLIIAGTPRFIGNSRQILELLTKYRLPGISIWRIFADAGLLMAYGPDLKSEFGRAADYVDKILRGAKPADLPVEQPTKFELVINAKTAKALGLTIPPSLLLRADQVIE